MEQERRAPKEGTTFEAIAEMPSMAITFYDLNPEQIERSFSVLRR